MTCTYVFLLTTLFMYFTNLYLYYFFTIIHFLLWDACFSSSFSTSKFKMAEYKVQVYKITPCFQGFPLQNNILPELICVKQGINVISRIF